MEGLVLQGGYTFLDTQYTDFRRRDDDVLPVRQRLVNCPVVWKDGEDNTV